MSNVRRGFRDVVNVLRHTHRSKARELVAAGNEANRRRDWADAEVAYAAALEIDPSLLMIWVQYGHALKEQGFLPRAEEAYRRALNLNDRIADTHLQLGHALKLQGRRDAALAAYRQAFILDPQSPHAKRELQAAGIDIPATPDAALHSDAEASPSPDARLARNGYTADAAFVQAAYDGATGKERPYVSLDHLLAASGLQADFLKFFDHAFYFYTNPGVREFCGSAIRERCLLHFCRSGIDALLNISEGHEFDAAFYRPTYLVNLPFTPANAYRHWLTTGIRQGHAPNRAAWILSALGEPLSDPDGLQVGATAAVGQLSLGTTLWTEQFRRFLDVVGEPGRPLAVNRKTASDLVRIADRLAIDGETQRTFNLYQLIAEKVPDNWRALRHYADGLLSRQCLLEASRIYERIIVEDPDCITWVYINLAQCLKQLGRPVDALAVLRQGVGRFPGDTMLRRRIREAASAAVPDAWQLAAAASAAGDIAAGQAGLKAVASAISDLAAPPGRLPARVIRSIALVANQDLAQCKFYRVSQKIEQLQAADYDVTVFDFHTDLPTFLAALPTLQAAIFYRVPAFFDVVEAIQKANELGVVTFYEIDDLIFDAPAYPASFKSYGGQIGWLDYCGLCLGVPLFERAMALCDYALASTPALAEKMAPIVTRKQAFVHRNALASRHLAHMKTTSRVQTAGPVTIFYGSGTKAHKEDFQELVEPALVQLVRRYGNRVSIILMGYVSQTERMRSISDQITFIDPDWNVDAYWSILRNVDINLAVLKSSVMADCKSEIKWLEAAMFGIPSVVSDTATYREVIEDGVTGLLCHTADDWTRALDRLVKEPELRRRIGDQARERAVSRYGVKVMSDNLRDILQQVGPEPAGQAPDRPRIVVVNVFYPPQAIGGATRVVHDNMRHLADHYGDRFDLRVFTSIEGSPEPYDVTTYAQDGVQVTGVTTPVEADIDQKLVDERMAKIFGAYVDEVKPGLVHLHCIQRLTASIVSVLIERSIPYILTVHDGWWVSDRQFLVDRDGSLRLFDYSDPLETLRRLGQDAFSRLVHLQTPLHKAAKILAVSAPFAEIYRRCGVMNVLALPNGVSVLPAPARTHGDGRVRLGFIGGMSAHKGFDLIRFALRNNAFKNLRLLVIDHAMSAGEKSEAVWGGTVVEFRPKVRQGEVGRLYGEIDVLLAPSIWPESYGLVTREALHCGCWVVASDRGAIGEYVDDRRNGFIVDVSNPDGLAGALARINADPVRFLQSPPAPRSMRLAAQQADELAALYAELLGQTTPTDGTHPAGAPVVAR